MVAGKRCDPRHTSKLIALARMFKQCRLPTKKGPEEDSVHQFLLEGEMFGVPGLVRWYAVRPADGALQWFDEKCAQDMFCSTTATKMLRRLKVKAAPGLRPPNVVELPTFRLTLESGVAVVGYPINP